jgi:hypothetical protein
VATASEAHGSQTALTVAITLHPDGTSRLPSQGELIFKLKRFSSYAAHYSSPLLSLSDFSQCDGKSGPAKRLNE